MSSRTEEEPTPDSELPHPVTPTKSPRNDGSSQANPDAAGPDRSDEEKQSGSKLIRPPRHVLQYEVVKRRRWVTGDRAEKDHKAIEAELDEIMRKHLELSCQKKFYGFRTLDSDLGGWKFARTHTNKRGVKYDVYHCPLRGRTGCQVSTL